ncbi:hypothetical protein [Candidatus Wolbachia massiliensis]|uniref:Uncharacterized protein n=1 Tax=Candidatus Wolbachia massiliensis TaxID=1845000 RepID=A0A7L7YQ64_9RICK|nr:hypothetical protein [Candidatus Wolbachia massiliensis]QOD37896.1 hypothetical protein ID128_03460 [Candidatus Wolbachia massiliensis]
MSENKDTSSIWRGRNTVHIIKTGIEYTAALASLAAAITTVLIATNVIAVPESLALVSAIANPVGIAVLSIIAVYFLMQAISSHQQMHRNEEINETKTPTENAKTTTEIEGLIKNEVEAKTKDLATKAELNNKVDESDVDARLAKKADKTYVDNQLAKKADTDKLNAKVDKTALKEVQESVADLTNNLNAKLNSSDLKEKVKSLLEKPEVTAVLKKAISEEAPA